VLRAVWSLLAVVMLAAAGCAGSDDSTDEESGSVPVARLSDAVLQPSDLPPVFTRFDTGRLVGSDLHPGPRETLDRFERRGGWKARYKRAGSSATPGPLVVQSLVDAFADVDHARDDLDAYDQEFREAVVQSGGAAKLIDVPQVGEETVAYLRVQHGNPATRFYTLAWRFGNVTASVAADGFEGLTSARVVRLARKQQAHIAALASRR
jgi:hypothetical protein